MNQLNMIFSRQRHGQIIQKKCFPGSRSPGNGDHRCALRFQILQNLLPEAVLLIRKEILSLQEFFRSGYRRNQIVGGAEKPVDPDSKVLLKGRAAQGLYQLLRQAPAKIVFVVQAVELARIHHKSIGENPAHRMGQIITVLLQLLFDPLPADVFALQFDV